MFCGSQIRGCNLNSQIEFTVEYTELYVFSQSSGLARYPLRDREPNCASQTIIYNVSLSTNLRARLQPVVIRGSSKIARARVCEQIAPECE